MKQLFIIAILFGVTLTSYSQSLGYENLALIFSQDDLNGSARFTAMSGAFGAIGGDMSSVNINPAGIAVYKNSAFSGTFNSRNSDITSTYYGNSLTTQDQFFNISHAGAVLVFDSATSSDWSKFALGFNYRITKDFNDSFSSQGNSGVATFTEFPLDNSSNPVEYNIAEEQFFNTVFNGEISELNIAFSAVHLNKLYIGASFNAFDLNFSQRALLTEFNTDGNGNELEVELYQENVTSGTGFSLGAGFIYNLHPSFRVGMSYQTPTWYSEILQDKNRPEEFDDLGEVTYFQGNDIYTEREFYEGIIYQLKTPSKLTASAALIFAKNGLISLDYTNKNYQNIKLSDGYFVEENQFFQNNLRNTHSFNVGTEWRIDRLSIRGGYRFEQSPYKNALDSDNLEGYSFGGGYNFGNMKIDISYSESNRTDTYNFYPQFTNVNPSNLELDNSTITATLTLSL
jgi:hypothetical protein